MNKTLSYVLLTPYTVIKGRAGGVLSRLLSQTDLELIGAKMFVSDKEFAKKYADTIRARDPQNQIMLLADYAEKHFVSSTENQGRALLFLFYGENPCEKLLNICGHLYPRDEQAELITGETVRGTYSDLIFSVENPEEVRYFEPAVYTPRNQKEANEDLRMIANFLDGKENLIQNILYNEPSKVERTLVIIKPDNWKHSSSRPGAIIDMFSRTGLRVIGVKIHRFSLGQAIEFYGPVEPFLIEKLAPIFGNKAKELLEKEFGFNISGEVSQTLFEEFGVEYAKNQFNQIIEFMTGNMCMILVYEGENAVQKIRDVLGATDPSKAADGTVRREFGSNVMVNTAHASDSIESYEREQNIVKVNENSIVSIIREHAG